VNADSRLGNQREWVEVLRAEKTENLLRAWALSSGSSLVWLAPGIGEVMSLVLRGPEQLEAETSS
jgi:hypothetical protein